MKQRNVSILLFLDTDFAQIVGVFPMEEKNQSLVNEVSTIIADALATQGYYQALITTAIQSITK